MTPRTQYVRNGDVSLAYQVVGEGPIDLVFTPGMISHVEHVWEEPGLARFLLRLSGIGRLIHFDRRGVGLSDRVPGTLDAEVADVDAVLDAAGSERAAVMAYATSGPLAVRYAVARPQRVSHLVLYACMARMVSAPGYDWTHDAAEREAAFEQTVEHWGEGLMMTRLAPSAADDERLREWYARLERLASSPGLLRETTRLAAGIDVRELLPRVAVPTLVLHRAHDEMIDVRHSRYIAEAIPGARYVELPGRDNLPSVGDPDALLVEIEEWLTGAPPRHAAPRALRTVMFTDIVDGTAQAARLGDERWRDLLAAHDAALARQLARRGGRVVKSTGDGILATFDGAPSEAVRCARDAVADLGELGLRVRTGLHLGECELIGEDIGGMAVHIAARVCELAGPGEILASGTVYGTVVGAGLGFRALGERRLKGVAHPWPIFAVKP